MGADNTKQLESESNEDRTVSTSRRSKQNQPSEKTRQSQGYISPVPNKRRLPPPESPSLLSPSPLQKPATPVIIKQDVDLPVQMEIIPTKQSATPAASTFEKAPIVTLNYVAKSSDSKSLHSYGLSTITVVRRTSSQSVETGNRWYNYDYRTNTKAPVQ